VAAKCRCYRGRVRGPYNQRVHEDWEHVGARVVTLAERLVACPSVVDTPGEGQCARLLRDYLREQTAGLDYVRVQAVAVDKQPPCEAILVTYEPPVPTARTLVLLGHFDTVGIEPYGTLAEHACSSAELKRIFGGKEPEVLAGAHERAVERRVSSAISDGACATVSEAAGSPDWAFGRGWQDMKGGVAAIVEVFLREARLRELPCNLVLGLAPDEESASRGVRALIPALLELTHQRGWELAYVLNADYTAPLHPGDERRYFYSGTVGKLLLGVSVFGKTTHVGETFDGVNTSALAGFLAGQLEHDRKLLAGTGGEWLPPPTVLHVADRRARYDVMTVDCAELYVNVFHLGGDPRKQWRALLNEVRRLVKLWDRQQRLSYNRFVARADVKLPRYAVRPEVIDYAELVRRTAGTGVLARGNSSEAETVPSSATGEGARATKHPDDREAALEIIRNLHSQLPPGRPLVVVSLLPPFYPAQLNSADKPDTAKLIALTRAEGLTHKRVYPYIADLSYFAFSPKATEGWEVNAPLWFEQTELANLQAAATTVCNVGPWGAGAHSETERVYLPYLRDKLPKILSAALRELAE